MTLAPLLVPIEATTRAFEEAMTKVRQEFIAVIPVLRRWDRAQRLVFPPVRIHRNARRRPKRQRRR